MMLLGRALKPGGQIEISEIQTQFSCDDGTLKPDSYCMKWAVGSLTASKINTDRLIRPQATFHEIAQTLGLDFDQVSTKLFIMIGVSTDKKRCPRCLHGSERLAS